MKDIFLFFCSVLAKKHSDTPSSQELSQNIPHQFFPKPRIHTYTLTVSMACNNHPSIVNKSA